MSGPQEWRAVPSAPGYEVSTEGQIRSWRPNVRPMPHFLKGRPDRKGYLRVNLRIAGKRQARYVHTLVMAAFVGPRPAGKQIRHLDGVKTHNELSNLAYGSASENLVDTIAHGTHRWANRTHCEHGHEYTEANIYRQGGSSPTRRCRQCISDRGRRMRQRRKAESEGAVA